MTDDDIPPENLCTPDAKKVVSELDSVIIIIYRRRARRNDESVEALAERKCPEGRPLLQFKKALRRELLVGEREVNSQYASHHYLSVDEMAGRTNSSTSDNWSGGTVSFTADTSLDYDSSTQTYMVDIELSDTQQEVIGRVTQELVDSTNTMGPESPDT